MATLTIPASSPKVLQDALRGVMLSSVEHTSTEEALTLEHSYQLPEPTRENIRKVLERAKIKPKDAARLVYMTPDSFAKYLLADSATTRRVMPKATWELLLLMTDQHPYYQVFTRLEP